MEGMSVRMNKMRGDIPRLLRNADNKLCSKWIELLVEDYADSLERFMFHADSSIEYSAKRDEKTIFDTESGNRIGTLDIEVTAEYDREASENLRKARYWIGQTGKRKRDIRKMNRRFDEAPYADYMFGLVGQMFNGLSDK